MLVPASIAAEHRPRQNLSRYRYYIVKGVLRTVLIRKQKKSRIPLLDSEGTRAKTKGSAQIQSITTGHQKKEGKSLCFACRMLWYSNLRQISMGGTSDTSLNQMYLFL